jgi:tetratricopeptide (TPR) repeat protein
MITTRSVLFALLSLGFLAVSANAQNANATEVEKLKAELATSPEGIDRLYEEAGDFYLKGKYREAKARMTRAYASFQRLEVNDKAKKVAYLRRLSVISYHLQENDKTIEYATEVAIHALTDDDRGFAYNTLGLAYDNKGEYAKAIGYHEKSLNVRLKTLGAEHPEVGKSYSNIGAVYSNKAEYDKAIGYHEKALAIRLKTLGPEHPLVGASYNNIGAVYSNKAEYDKALGYHEKALAIQLKTLGAEHPAVATSYFWIGLVYSSKGEYDKAIGYLLKAKPIFLKKLGAQHPSTKDVQSGIDLLKVATARLKAELAIRPDDIDRLAQEAVDFYGKGKYREAKASMTRAYAAFERLEVKDKAKRVNYLRLLSNISDALQENDKTIEYATQVAIHALTDDDRGFAYNNIAIAYLKKGEYDKAIGYYEKSLAIRLKVLEAEHPEVATTYNNLGSAYLKKGEYDKAIGYYEKSLPIQLKALGAEHPSVATSYNNIGSAYQDKGEYDKAIGYLEKALAIKLKKLGSEHPSVGINYNDIGLVYTNKGEYHKAIGYYEKSLAIYLKTLGAKHPEVATTYNNIGLAYHRKAEYDKALGYYEKALAIQLKALGSEHPDVGTSYFNIGAVYANLKRGFFGKHKKSDKKMAMAYLLKAKAIFLPRLGAQHPQMKNLQSWIDGLK